MLNQKSKLRILMCSEASFINSGFGKYAYEFLSRLHKTGKYEIAEFASYGFVNDPRDKNIDWRYYANAVRENDPRYKEYMSRTDNQFGRWRFEKVLLDFKCDLVIDVRDYWMTHYQPVSPLRSYFHHILMPTVDSAPQQEEWIDTFLSADAVFTYSDWGAEVLKEQSNGAIKYIDTTTPGVNLDVFYMKDRKQLREKFKIDPDSFIFGSVMRNQKRKLIPELFSTLKQLLSNLSQQNNSQKVYLYMHTTYPDMGWDIPELLNQYKVANNVLFSYLCKQCGHVECSTFSGPQKICSKCLNKSSAFPSVSQGVSEEQLSDIYNLFDLYVQYAICLGKNEQIKIKRNEKAQWVPISQVQIGDEAWTHKNRWRKVSRVWKNLAKSHNKKILELSVHGDYEKLIATENHEFPAYTSKELKIKHRSIRENIGYYLYNNKDLPEYNKYQLSDLSPGDMLLFPIDDTVKDIDTIDICKEIDCSDCVVLDSFIETSSKYSYPRFINIDNNFCKFIGLFAADGSWESRPGCKNIKITSHIKETKNQDLAFNCMTQIGSNNNTISNRIYKDRLGIDAILGSKLHTKLFAKWFSKHEDKQLPDWCLYLPLEKQKEILIGMFMGDGHYCKEKNYSQISTISKPLADQIKHILRRLRIPFSVSKINRTKHKTQDHKNRKDCYSFEIYGCDIKNGDIKNKRNGSYNVYYKNNHIIQIKSIVESDYNDDVWCLTVDDDHTMTTKIGATFQCEGLGIPQVEAGACGIPIATVDYSAMVDIINKLQAFPIRVQTYFKELETKAIRVYPDNNDLIRIILEQINKPLSIRNQERYRTRQLTEQNYDWDIIIKKWENYFDSLDFRADWNKSLPSLSLANKPKNSDNRNNLLEMVEICNNNLKNADLLSSVRFLQMLQNADYGFSYAGPTNITAASIDNIYDHANVMIENNNNSETALRLNKTFEEDFIQYAHLKSQT
jgi:glycosyltransferase involved in cell wall biosynthesis